LGLEKNGKTHDKLTAGCVPLCFPVFANHPWAPLLNQIHSISPMNAPHELSHLLHHCLTPAVSPNLVPIPNLMPLNSNPRNAAWGCQLTPALLLRGFSVGFGGIPMHESGYAQVFEKPLPAPVEPIPMARVRFFAGTGTGSPEILQSCPCRSLAGAQPAPFCLTLDTLHLSSNFGGTYGR
jgi:hypothetical protein